MTGLLMPSHDPSLNDLLGKLIAFALGGLVGHFYLMWKLTSVDHKTWPWMRRASFWRFLGEKSMAEDFERLEKERRHMYGIELMATLSDLGGPGPWPRSPQAVRNVLDESERRFQIRMKRKAK